MVDDSKYVIVPNKTEGEYKDRDEAEPSHSSNDNGRYLAKLVKDGYRIISKMSSREAVHYVLIKFNPGSRPARAGAEPAIPLEEENPVPTA